MIEIIEAKKPEITATEEAVTYLKKQLAKEGRGIGIRFGVKKSGCSGYAYVVEVIEQTEPTDHIFPIAAGLLIAVDPKSFLLVQGTRIDYVRKGINGQLSYLNPQEKNNCGCGESFVIEE